MRIAIIDDSNSFRTYLESLLRADGHDDIVTYPLAEALFDALDDPDALFPDLVLMDCIMPGLGGLAGTRRLKADPRLADVPVIMITVSDDEENLAAAFDAGAMDYILKPPRRAELVARVASALRLKQAIDARQARERELREERDRISAILEYAQDGIAVIGRDGRFTFVSPGMERLFGLPVAAYASAGSWMRKVFPEAADRADLGEILTTRPAPGQVWRRLYAFTDHSGQRRTCQIHFSTMPGGELICNIEDVTLFAKQKEELQKKHSRHQKDLEAAAEIQRSLLPRRVSMSPGLRFAWEFLPCESIGGDIFNVFPLGPHHVGLYMLDVSGHGVASSLVALSVYHFMHYKRSTLVDRSEGVIDVVPPEAVLTRLDEEFPFDKFSKFFTMCYLTLDTRSGRLRYCNAGHPPPLAIVANGGITTLPSRGTIIGLSGFQPFPAGEAILRPGDKLIVHSDGLPDTQDAAGEFFGEERTLDVVQKLADRPIQDIVSGLRQAAAAFLGDTPPRDDVSLLGLEVLRNTPAAGGPAA